MNFFNGQFGQQQAFEHYYPLAAAPAPTPQLPTLPPPPQLPAGPPDLYYKLFGIAELANKLEFLKHLFASYFGLDLFQHSVDIWATSINFSCLQLVCNSLDIKRNSGFPILGMELDYLNSMRINLEHQLISAIFRVHHSYANMQLRLEALSMNDRVDCADQRVDEPAGQRADEPAGQLSDAEEQADEELDVDDDDDDEGRLVIDEDPPLGNLNPEEEVGDDGAQAQDPINPVPGHEDPIPQQGTVGGHTAPITPISPPHHVALVTLESPPVQRASIWRQPIAVPTLKRQETPTEINWVNCHENLKVHGHNFNCQYAQRFEGFANAQSQLQIPLTMGYQYRLPNPSHASAMGKELKPTVDTYRPITPSTRLVYANTGRPRPYPPPIYPWPPIAKE